MPQQELPFPYLRQVCLIQEMCSAYIEAVALLGGEEIWLGECENKRERVSVGVKALRDLNNRVSKQYRKFIEIPEEEFRLLGYTDKKSPKAPQAEEWLDGLAKVIESKLPERVKRFFTLHVGDSYLYIWAKEPFFNTWNIILEPENYYNSEYSSTENQLRGERSVQEHAQFWHSSDLEPINHKGR